MLHSLLERSPLANRLKGDAPTFRWKVCQALVEKVACQDQHSRRGLASYGPDIALLKNERKHVYGEYLSRPRELACRSHRDATIEPYRLWKIEVIYAVGVDVSHGSLRLDGTRSGMPCPVDFFGNAGAYARITRPGEVLRLARRGANRSAVPMSPDTRKTYDNIVKHSRFVSARKRLC